MKRLLSRSDTKIDRSRQSKQTKSDTARQKLNFWRWFHFIYFDPHAKLCLYFLYQWLYFRQFWIGFPHRCLYYYFIIKYLQCSGVFFLAHKATILSWELNFYNKVKLFSITIFQKIPTSETQKHFPLFLKISFLLSLSLTTSNLTEKCAHLQTNFEILINAYIRQSF